MASDVGMRATKPFVKHSIPGSNPVALLEGYFNEKVLYVSMERYAKDSKSIWDSMHYSVPATENPLLRELPKRSNSVLDYLKRVDPSVKTDLWHMQDSSYGRHFWAAAYKLSKYLKQDEALGEPELMRRVLEMTGQWRNWVAMNKKLDFLRDEKYFLFRIVKDIGSFGVFQSDIIHDLNALVSRNRAIHTNPLSGNYARLTLHLSNDLKAKVEEVYGLLYEEFRDVLQRPSEEPLTPIQTDATFSVEQNFAENIVTSVILDGKEIVFVKFLKQQQRMWIVFDGFSNEAVSNKMSEILVRIIVEAKQKSLPDSEFDKMVATLHWFMANTAPYYRGTAAVADLLTATCYLLRGKRWPGWKQNVSADVLALSTSRLSTFQNLFSHILNGRPKIIPPKWANVPYIVKKIRRKASLYPKNRQ